jgi:hypothetical protein
VGCLTIVVGLVYSTERRSTVPTGVFLSSPGAPNHPAAGCHSLERDAHALSSTDICFALHCGVRDPRNNRISRIGSRPICSDASLKT